MLHVLSPLTALFLSFIILMLGNGLQSTLLAVRAGTEGASDTGVGLMMSAYFLGYALGSFLGAPVVARAGPVRTFAALTSIVSAIALAHLLVIDLTVWIAFRFVHGACFATLVLVVESWINASTARARRGQVLSLYGLTFLIGGAASQPLLNLASPEGFALFCVVSMLASIALVPVTLAAIEEPKGLSPSRLSVSALWSASPLGVAGVMVAGFAVSAFWGLGPAYANGIGLSDQELSLFMFSTLGGAIFTQLPLGWLSDQTDRRLVIVGAAGGMGAAALLLALFATMPLALLLASGALFGAMTMPIYSLCVAQVNDRIDADRVVAVAGGLILIYGFSAAAGPFLTGIAMDVFGPRGLFAVMATVAVGLAAFGVVRVTQKTQADPDTKQAYAEAPRTSHVLTDIDPRQSPATSQPSV